MMTHEDMVIEAVAEPYGDSTLDHVVGRLLDNGARLSDAISAVVHAIADEKICVRNDKALLTLTVPEIVKETFDLHPDTTKLKLLSSTYLHMMANGANVDRIEKVRDEIFEAAIETIFGANIWHVINRIER